MPNLVSPIPIVTASHADGKITFTGYRPYANLASSIDVYYEVLFVKLSFYS